MPEGAAARPPLLPPGGYAFTPRLQRLNVCMKFGMAPQDLDRLHERDPNLVLDMIHAVLYEREEMDRRFEQLARLIAGGARL